MLDARSKCAKIGYVLRSAGMWQDLDYTPGKPSWLICAAYSIPKVCFCPRCRVCPVHSGGRAIGSCFSAWTTCFHRDPNIGRGCSLLYIRQIQGNAGCEHADRIFWADAHADLHWWIERSCGQSMSCWRVYWRASRDNTIGLMVSTREYAFESSRACHHLSAFDPVKLQAHDDTQKGLLLWFRNTCLLYQGAQRQRMNAESHVQAWGPGQFLLFWKKRFVSHPSLHRRIDLLLAETWPWDLVAPKTFEFTGDSQKGDKTWWLGRDRLLATEFWFGPFFHITNYCFSRISLLRCDLVVLWPICLKW